MSRLHLICVDVGAGSGPATEVVGRAVAQASGCDRVLCFGAAARLAGHAVREEREAREGRWLDDAATWLLAGQALSDPPARPGSGSLATRIVGVGRPGLDVGALQLTERFVELVGGLLVMAVASEEHIDDVDNAHLWLVGGKPFGVDTGQGRAGGRAVVGVGGSVVTIVVSGTEAAIGARTLDGDEMAPVTVSLGGQNRMSVRGASP